MSRPFILGLTGSIGMGKSTVAAMFEAAGVPVFDADATVRRLQGPNGQLLPAIEQAFPGSTGSEGVLRDKLGALVFADPDALLQLERIVHPVVAAERQSAAASANPVTRAGTTTRPPRRRRQAGGATTAALHAPARAARSRPTGRRGRSPVRGRCSCPVAAGCR